MINLIGQLTAYFPAVFFLYFSAGQSSLLVGWWLLGERGIIVVLAIVDLESAGDTDSDYLSGDILMIGLCLPAYPC